MTLRCRILGHRWVALATTYTPMGAWERNACRRCELEVQQWEPKEGAGWPVHRS